MANSWTRYAGAVLVAWAVVNTAVSVSRYGLDNGMYWWFCNLAMIGVGLGLIARHRGWIIGFLAIASFTQTFWIFDNLWRVTTGENLIGLVEFMYQPGNPMDEFLLSHYHFFIIPTGLLGLFYITERRDLPTWGIVATNVFIFGISYFAFPRVQNVNCSHEPCLFGLEHWGGPLYFVLFSTAVCLGCIGITRGLTRALDRWMPGAREQRRALRVYAVVVVGALAMTGFDYRIKVGLPSFACGTPFEANGVRARCRFTLEEAPKVLSLTFRLENLGRDARVCRPFLEYEGGRRQIGDARSIAAGTHEDIRTLLPYPSRDVVARVTADCGEREVATDEVFDHPGKD